MMKFLSRNKVILILFLITLTSRSILVFTADGIAKDGCSYALLAKEFAAGNLHKAFSSILPPLFPLLTAGISFMCGDFEISGRIISCLFGSLTVFPLFFLVKNIFDTKTALITVLFFILHPYLWQAGGEVLTEALYYFLLTSIACLCWAALKKRKSLLFSAVGPLLLLAFLTRFEGFFLIFLVLGWIWLVNPSKIKAEIRWRFINSLTCLVTFIMAMLPYLLIVHHETGKWQVCSRQEHYENVFFKPTDENQTPLQRAGRVIKGKFSYSIPRIPFYCARSYYPVFLPFLFFGLIGRKRFGAFKLGEAYILSFILLRITTLLVFAGINARYLYALVPMALSWAGAGFCEIDYQLQEKFKTKTLSVGGETLSRFSIIILVLIAAICLPRGLKPIRGHRAIQKEAGYWLKEKAGQKDFVVVSPSPQESFYAGAGWYVMEGDTYTEIINNARAKDADFIIIDKNIDTLCPAFRDSVRLEDLEILTDQFEDNPRKILIYRLKK